MSRSARFTGLFGDGKHDFQLKIAQLEELQEKTDAGPEELMERVMSGRWRVADITETLRLGLIGQGMDATTALLMVARYAAPGQLGAQKPLVTGILGAAVYGAPDEDAPPPEKPKRRRATASPAASSASRPSTKSAARSASPRARSATAPSGS